MTGETTGGNAPSQDPPDQAVPGPSMKDLDIAVPIVLDVGWTMAVLFGFIRDNQDQALNQLPTEHELIETERVAVECSRLNSQLDAPGRGPSGS